MHEAALPLRVRRTQSHRGTLDLRQRPHHRICLLVLPEVCSERLRTRPTSLRGVLRPYRLPSSSSALPPDGRRLLRVMEPVAKPRDGLRRDQVVHRRLRVGLLDRLQDLVVAQALLQHVQDQVAAFVRHLLAHEALRVVVQNRVTRHDAVRAALDRQPAGTLHLHARTAVDRTVEHLLVNVVVGLRRARDHRLVQALLAEPLAELGLVVEVQAPVELVRDRHVHLEVAVTRQHLLAARTGALPQLLRLVRAAALLAPLHDDAAARARVRLHLLLVDAGAAHLTRRHHLLRTQLGARAVLLRRVGSGAAHGWTAPDHVCGDGGWKGGKVQEVAEKQGHEKQKRESE